MVERCRYLWLGGEEKHAQPTEPIEALGVSDELSNPTAIVALPPGPPDPRVGPGAPVAGNLIPVEARSRSGRVSSHLLMYASIPLLLLVVVVLVYLQSSGQDSESLGPNLSVILFINFGVIVLLALAFLVSRHLVKLAFDRRKNVLGSRLRMRLVAAFGGLTLIPTAAVFVLASGLLNQAIEGWVSSQTETARHAALTVARAYTDDLSDGLAKDMAAINMELRRILAGRVAEQNTAELSKFLERERRVRGLFSLTILRRNGRALVNSSHATASLEPFREPPLELEAVKRANRGTPSLLTEDTGSGSFIRSYTGLTLGRSQFVLIGSYRVDPDVAEAFDLISSSVKEYEQLRLFKNPLKSGYILTLTMVTAMVLFAVIWLALYISKQIVGPVEQLAKGTQAVARGNYDITIEARGDDEIGYLVRSFNRMLADLRSSRDEATRRRTFAESILGYLAIGVISLDSQGLVTTCNRAALLLFGIEGDVVGRELKDVLPPQAIEVIEPLLERLRSGDASQPRTQAEAPLRILSQGRTLSVLCTLGKIVDPNGVWTGTLLLFDDITELSQAQQMSAWREVARRVAHEIKNPLTPIQLSAQRLARLFPDSHEVSESADTIVENVDSIKRLANDFSNFARMPTAVFQRSDINNLIEEILGSFAERHSNITFQFIAEERLVELVMDPEQIRRLLINLIDNAVLALLSEGGEDATATSHPKKVSLRTSYDRRRRVAILEVADNGPGIRSEHKSRIFEPYFTMRDGGSGLGLAVVNSVVADHHGQIRVYDNHPRGAKFIIELPMSQKEVTQRRLKE